MHSDSLVVAGNAAVSPGARQALDAAGMGSPFDIAGYREGSGRTLAHLAVRKGSPAHIAADADLRMDPCRTQVHPAHTEDQRMDVEDRDRSADVAAGAADIGVATLSVVDMLRTCSKDSPDLRHLRLTVRSHSNPHLHACGMTAHR